LDHSLTRLLDLTNYVRSSLSYYTLGEVKDAKCDQVARSAPYSPDVQREPLRASPLLGSLAFGPP
jgi:hypothetical protein